ncbi:hypothetical protein BpHYR1_048730 [Brachionus plicatilis]|uniref:Uncharacterized protein n=1 Tax=Brachionus plicatilis TaxID=10195 RepID=A0A3M7Q9C6_BRAPC|nr:hypothetical protein BpHYR1_048730 [Brachionus plicatilis]
MAQFPSSNSLSGLGCTSRNDCSGCGVHLSPLVGRANCSCTGRLIIEKLKVSKALDSLCDLLHHHYYPRRKERGRLYLWQKLRLNYTILWSVIGNCGNRVHRRSQWKLDTLYKCVFC